MPVPKGQSLISAILISRAVQHVGAHVRRKGTPLLCAQVRGRVQLVLSQVEPLVAPQPSEDRIHSRPAIRLARPGIVLLGGCEEEAAMAGYLRPVRVPEAEVDAHEVLAAVLGEFMCARRRKGVHRAASVPLGELVARNGGRAEVHWKRDRIGGERGGVEEPEDVVVVEAQFFLDFRLGLMRKGKFECDAEQLCGI